MRISQVENNVYLCTPKSVVIYKIYKMKKIFTLLFALVAFVSNSMAQHGAMKFAGKASFTVLTTTVNVESDTIVYAGSDFTIPSMTYDMGGRQAVIPSFVIKETTFEGGYAGVTWNEQEFTTTATDGKAVTGKILLGTFTHDNGIYNVKLKIQFKYGQMPHDLTYEIDGFYVKAWTDRMHVFIDKDYSVESVTYNVRTYIDGETTKVDVEVPTFDMKDTTIGDLTSGGYTVRGLVMDSSKGGYYRDYHEDGLTMHFKGVGMDADYPLSAANVNNILVVFEGKAIKIVNAFKPGAMPFPITSTFPEPAPAAIEGITMEKSAINMYYNLNGQRVVKGHKGLVIRNGKKYLIK